MYARNSKAEAGKCLFGILPLFSYFLLLLKINVGCLNKKGYDKKSNGSKPCSAVQHNVFCPSGIFTEKRIRLRSAGDRPDPPASGSLLQQNKKANKTAKNYHKHAARDFKSTHKKQQSFLASALSSISLSHLSPLCKYNLRIPEAS